MASYDNRGRRSITGGLLIIVIGVVFLLINLHPELELWPIAFRYWPVILIVIGLGKIWDAFQMRNAPGAPGDRNDAGVSVGVLVLIGLLIFAAWHGRGRGIVLQESQTVELQGAKSVTANLELPTGTLNVSGGGSHLLDANFRYRQRDGRPYANYSVSNGEGALEISQDSPSHTHLAGSGNDWQLRFADDIPLDMTVEIGAGTGVLRTNGLSLNHLEVKIGAGQLNLDLTGPRKSDLHVDIQGGVGSGIIRVPKDVGARIHASGGIGSVSAHDLHKDGDEYTNDALGKTPATIDVNINGGVGRITLEQQ
jgi:hypothetical protein